jgi:hypothetical protein
MPTQCKMIELTELPEGYKKQPGDMWYLRHYVRDGKLLYCPSNQYKRDWADKRLPLVVILPNGETWEMDRAYGGNPNNDGWTITGEAPNITAMPSINAIREPRESGYHGWLKNGILSDDLEGRTYEKVIK